MTMEPSGPSFTVVAPGSADDPFSVHGAGGQTQDPGTTPVNVSGPASQPVVQPPVQVPASGPVAPVTAPPAEPAALTQAQVDAIVVSRLQAAQSGWDKRNKLLEDQLKSEREARETEAIRHRDELRRTELEGLRPEDQTRLRQQWDYEDRKAELDKQSRAVLDYHKTVEGLRLLTVYAPYGVTEEQLLAIEDVDAMESFCKDAKIAFLEAGGKPNSPAPVPGKQVPPGSVAPYDSGGSPPGTPGPQVLTTTGVEAMGANIKNMFAQGGNTPW